MFGLPKTVRECTEFEVDSIVYNTLKECVRDSLYIRCRTSLRLNIDVQ